MDVWDEADVLKERRKLKKRFDEFLKEEFEDPEHSDILVEKQVKEGKKKHL